MRSPRNAVTAILLSLFLSSGAGAQGELTMDDLVAGAVLEAPAVLEAGDALEAALLERDATLPLGSSSLGLDAGAGFSTPETASANASASLNLPILQNLSVNAGLSWTDRDLAAADGQGEGLSASAALLWNPFASASSGSRARDAVEAAGRALEEARREARQKAYAAAAAWLRADSALEAARENLAIGDLSLSAVQLGFDRGQASPVELLEARAEHAELERSAYKAGIALEEAREALADAVGGKLGERIRSGAELDLSGAQGEDDGWKAPAFAELPETAALMRAWTALAAAREDVLSRGSGPLSLSAGLSGPTSGGGASFSLKASFDLDAALVSGREETGRALEEAKATRAYEAAQEAARDAYDKALRALSDAEFALKMAAYEVEGAQAAEARARLLDESGAISEVDLRKSVQALKGAQASRAAARLELAAARAWFEI